MEARHPGTGPRVLIESAPDTASVNIATRLRANHAWEETGRELDGATILSLGASDGPPIFLATIADWHIRREGLGEAVAAALGMPIEALLVLSRHRAASGHPSFTAHPVGNPGPAAIAGGQPTTPTPTHPHLLAAAYRALKRHAAPSTLPHSVSLEATHHGPLTTVPVVFIEIGSDDRHWDDRAAGEVVARAAYDAVRHVPGAGTRTIIGIGSGHYAPRFADLLDATPASVGHILAAYHWKEGGGIDRATLAAFVAASAPPGAAAPDGAYVDRKSLSGAHRTALLADLEALGVPLLRTADLA